MLSITRQTRNSPIIPLAQYSYNTLISPHLVCLSQRSYLSTSSSTQQAAHNITIGMKGRCQCSKIQFTTPAAKPLRINVCHCTECRHQSSSAFGITAIFPYFELPESAPDLVGTYTRRTLKGRTMECLFCKNCGTRLIHRFRDVVPSPGDKPSPSATSSVKGGCLVDLDAAMMRDAIHIWCQHAIVPIPEGVERWEQAPPKPNPLEP